MTHPNNQNEEHVFSLVPNSVAMRCSCGKEYATTHEQQQHIDWHLRLASHPKPTQAEDGDLDEILQKVDSLKTDENPEGNPFLPGSLSIDEAKQRLLALKSTWQAEARRQMLAKLPEKKCK